MGNLEELKIISGEASLGEIIEKTKSNGLVWTQTSKSSYYCESLPYELKLSQAGFTLDILKDGNLYRSYQSQDLYELVAEDPERLDRLRILTSALTN